MVNSWPLPKSDNAPPPYRLLVGMQRLPHEQLAAWLSESEERLPDNKRMAQLRKDAAREFRKQLTYIRTIQSGQLGTRRGARFRVYERLQDYLSHREGDLILTDQVRAAIQAVYDHPLTTEAVDKLNRQLRSNISDDDLAALVTTLHRDDRLVVANLHDEPAKDPRILCSIGLAD